MKKLLSLFTLSLTLLVTLPSHGRAEWRFDSYQEDNRVHYSTETYQPSNGDDCTKAPPSLIEERELLTLPDDVKDRQEEFFRPRDDIIPNLPQLFD